MTKKEAVERLREFCTLKPFCELYPEECRKEECEIYLAIEALEKQMPKKAELDVEDLICPVCGADVEWKRYCEECGQKIYTGEEE